MEGRERTRSDARRADAVRHAVALVRELRRLEGVKGTRGLSRRIAIAREEAFAAIDRATRLGANMEFELATMDADADMAAAAAAAGAPGPLPPVVGLAAPAPPAAPAPVAAAAAAAAAPGPIPVEFEEDDYDDGYVAPPSPVAVAAAAGDAEDAAAAALPPPIGVAAPDQDVLAAAAAAGDPAGPDLGELGGVEVALEAELIARQLEGAGEGGARNQSVVMNDAQWDAAGDQFRSTRGIDRDAYQVDHENAEIPLAGNQRRRMVRAFNDGIAVEQTQMMARMNAAPAAAAGPGGAVGLLQTMLNMNREYYEEGAQDDPLQMEVGPPQEVVLPPCPTIFHRRIFNNNSGAMTGLPPVVQNPAWTVLADDVVREVFEDVLAHLPAGVLGEELVRSLLGGSFLLSRTLRIAAQEYIGGLLEQHPSWKIGLQVRLTVYHEPGGTRPSTSLEKTIVSPSLLVLLRDMGAHQAWIELLAGFFNIFSERDLGQSGFQLLSVQSVTIDAARFQPTQVGKWINTPAAVRRKRCTINIHNYDDEMCALNAFTLGVLHHEDQVPAHPELPEQYRELAKRFDWRGITFPMPLEQWDKFESRNPLYQVFVYGVETADDGEKLKNVNILRLPKNRGKNCTPVYLLLLEKTVAEGEDRSHYVTITNISHLLNTHHHRGLACPFCACRIRNRDEYDMHVLDCSTVCTAKCSLPPLGSVKQFESFEKTQRKPVTIYADFECRMEDMSTTDQATGETIIEKLHVPISFAVHVNNIYEGKSVHELECRTVLYRNADPVKVVQELLNTLSEYSVKIKDYLLRSSQHEHPNHKAAARIYPSWKAPAVCVCKICGDNVHAQPSMTVRIAVAKRQLADENRRRKRKHGGGRADADDGDDDGPVVEEMDEDSFDEVVALISGMQDPQLPDDAVSVIDQVVSHVDFFSGEQDGYAHALCENHLGRIQRKQSIPCFFHNGTGYDIKLILQYIGQCDVDGVEQAFCIARTAERFQRIDICGVSIVDSLSHLNSSLDALIQRITNKGEFPDRCSTIKTGICGMLDEAEMPQWTMMAKKGVFPYSWLDSYDKLAETALPPIEAFTSDLDGKTISAEEYAFAQKVWVMFSCRTFADYHDIYLLTDVWGLCDAMQNYVNFAMSNYGIDPTHYASAPAAANDAMLRLTGARIELVTDIITYRAFESAIRGGISMACQPHAVAENKYTRLANGDTSMRELFDDTFLLSLDENNMYGGAMCRKLPVGGFTWLSAPEVAAFDIWTRLTVEDGDVGYLLEVDIEFPQELHDYFNDFPPAPTSLMVDDAWLSELQRTHIHAKDKKMVKTRKLVPHLMKHEKYMVNGCTLRLYLDIGVEVTAVHRILSFRQEAIIRPFVELNTELRKKAAAVGDLFGVDQAKMWVNSVYGKQLQDVRRYSNYKIVRSQTCGGDAKRLLRMVAKNTLRRVAPMGSVFVMEFNKKTVLLNQPVFLGATILDYAKLSIYRFWYQVMKTSFPDVRLVYTDTDSLICLVKSGDIYRDCKAVEERIVGGPVVRAGQGVFDWSSLDPEVHPEYFSNVNNKELGKFKFDDGSLVPGEFIALRSKMYTKTKVYNIATGKYAKSKSTAKGVPRECASQLDYANCLLSGNVSQVTFRRFTGRQFQIATRTMHKEGLAPAFFNDKRHITKTGDGRWEAFALGHYSLACEAESVGQATEDC